MNVSLNKLFRKIFAPAFVFLTMLIVVFMNTESAFAAAPTYQNASAVVASTGADVTVTLPAHLTNDIFLLSVLVRDTNDTITWPAGWTQIATVDRGATARYWWAWKRAASGAETNPLVDKNTATGDTYARVISFRGGATGGDPWDVKGAPTVGTTDPAILPGVTTAIADSLIVGAISGEDDNNVSVTWTATSPAALTDRYAESATGVDGMIDFSHGVKTTPGATGNLSANFSVANPVGWGGMVLALRPSPGYQGVGAIAASTGADVTATLPAHQANDIFLLSVLVRDTNDTITWPAGWTQIATVDRGATARYWWAWKRAASGAETNPLVDKNTATGDTYARVISFRGAITVGDPWEVKGTPATSITQPAILNSITSISDDSLIVAALSGEDNINVSVSWVGTDPATLTDVYASSATGADGMIDFGHRVKKTAGATGNLVATFSNGNPVGWGAIVLALRPPPVISSYTNTTESVLGHTPGCVNCGARIGGGAGFRQTATISGSALGLITAGNRSTVTNNIKVGTHQIPDANITAWTQSSITFLTDSATAGDTDTDWGANFGGALAITVTAGGQTTTGLNFYVFPQVTSLTTCDKVGFPAGSNAREYDVGDIACPNALTDGQVILNGTRFGTGATGGWVRILGCDATTCAGPTGTITIDSWSNTAVQVRVPTVISDTIYTGSLIMQQGQGSQNKPHTYTATGFRILPRIIANTPSSGLNGDRIAITGNHFCQGVGCPVAPNRSTVADNVNFDVTQASDGDFVNSGAAPCSGNAQAWTHTEVCINVPASLLAGSRPTVLQSNTIYISNIKNFNVNSPIPSIPTLINQWRNAGLTTSIPVGDYATATPIYFAMNIEVGVPGGTLYPQIEYQPIGTGFVCGAGTCASAVSGTGVSGPGPVDCNVVGNGCAISVAPADGTYHWQARVRHNVLGVDYFSAWVSYPEMAPNAETITDVNIDTTAPVISSISSGAPGSNTVNISWNTATEQSSTQVQYNTTGTFVTNCATNNDCTVFDGNPIFIHNVPIVGLSASTIYYYRVRSVDAAGNESISPVNTFTTLEAANQPLKTTRFYIDGVTGVVTGGTPSTKIFTVVLPENSVNMKSAFITIRGIYDTTGVAPNGIAVGLNAEAPITYALPVTGTAHIESITLLHQISAINIDPATNTLTITPEANTAFHVLSAEITLTYGYTP